MKLVYKTLLPIVLVMGLTAVVTGAFLRMSLENTLLKEQYLRISDQVLKTAQEQLGDIPVLLKVDSADEILHLKQFSESIKDASIIRVTFWDHSHRILYSDLSSIIGIQSPVHPEIDRAFAGESFFVRKNVDSNFPRQSSVDDFIDIYIPIQTYGNIIGVVEIQSVAGAVFLPIAQEIRYMEFVLFASMFIVAGILFLVFSRFIIQPISQALSLAQAVSDGNFEPHTIPAQNDEIGILVKSLDRMRERLRSLVGNLEHEVDTRTRSIIEEKTRITAALGALSAGLAIVDAQGHVLYGNPALERALGLREQPTLLSHIATHFGGAYDIAAAFQQSITQQKSTDQNYIPVGTHFLRVFTAPIIVAQSREILGAVILLDDVTEAKVLDRSREEFFTIASHELRTPLAAIRANASLLKKYFTKLKKKDDIISSVDDIHTAAVRLAKIVHDFIDIAALEQGAATLHIEKVDIVQISAEVIQELQSLAIERNLTLSLDTTTSLFVKADSQRLKEVILNLVGNALQHTERGSVTVSCNTKGDKGQVFVTDTGAGIPSSQQSLLFRKFQQAGESLLSRDGGEGTGLGLYISKLIIESMQGRVWLEKSTPAVGSVFALDIPLAP